MNKKETYTETYTEWAERWKKEMEDHPYYTVKHSYSKIIGYIKEDN